MKCYIAINKDIFCRVRFLFLYMPDIMNLKCVYFTLFLYLAYSQTIVSNLFIDHTVIRTRKAGLRRENMFQRTRAYADDYERIGSTVRYKGKHYRFTMEQPALNRRKTAYVLSLALAVALFVAIGFSGSPALGGGGQPTPAYVVLPYVVLMLPLGLGLARAVLLAFKTRPMEFAEYDKNLVQQKGILLTALILCGVVLLGLLLYLFIGAADAGSQWLAILETVACAGCIFLAFLQYHALFGSISIDEATRVRYDV